MNAVTAPLKLGQKGQLVADLQLALQWLIDHAGVDATDAAKKEYGLLLRREAAVQTFGNTTAKLVALVQHAAGLAATGAVDDPTAKAINSRVKQTGGNVDAGGAGVASADAQTLTGIALFQRGQPAVGVDLHLYQLNLDGTEKALGNAASESAGRLTIPFTAEAGPLQWQLRLADGTPLISVKVGRPENDPITVVVPDNAVTPPDEWTRLLADMDAMGVGADTLAALQESDKRRDLTALAAETGWDSRVLALAATAARIATTRKLSRPAVYAVLRVGAAADESGLISLSPQAVAESLTRAVKGHIVALTDADVKAAVDAFSRYSAERRLGQVPTGLVSAPADLLAASGLSDADKTAFTKALASLAGTDTDVWKAASQSGVSAGGIKTLQRQGKLALLTAHSAPLAAKLASTLGASMNVGDLAFQGLFDAAAWSALIDKVAADAHVAVSTLIPSTGDGDTDDARKQNYATAMARAFRIAYPTRTIAAKVLSGDIASGQTADERKRSSETLVRADDAGFVIGRTPVGPFLKKQGDGLFAGVAKDARSAQEAELRRLQRLYQLSPDDSSMAVLSTLQLDDARKISAFSQREFLAFAGGKFDVANADRSRFVA